MNLECLQARLEELYAHLDRRWSGRLSLPVWTMLAFDRDDSPLMAQSIAHYALFAVFPEILAFIVVASVVLESIQVQESVMALASEHMPVALDFVAANIEQLLRMREGVGLIALVGLVWSASGAFSAIFRAVNRAWGIPMSTVVLSEKLYALATISVIGAFFLSALSINSFVSLARAWQVPLLDWQPAALLRARPGTDWLVGCLSAPVPALLSVGAFILMYRTMPRARVRRCDVWLGGHIASPTWEMGQQIFARYLGNFAANNVILRFGIGKLGF